MKTIKTSGLIIQSKPFFEKDRLLVVFTESLGLIRILVKGAQSKSFRYGAKIEPLTLVDLTLKKGKSFYFLISIDIQMAFLKLKKNYNCLMFMFYCCDLVKLVCVYEQVNVLMYDLLCNICVDLDQLKPIKLLHKQFCVDLLNAEGLYVTNNDEFSYTEFVRIFTAYAGSVPKLPQFLNTSSLAEEYV